MNLAELRHSIAVESVEKLVESEFHETIDWRTLDGEDLKLNIGLTRGNNVDYRRIGVNGKRVGAEIVLKFVNGELKYKLTPHQERISQRL